MSSVNNEENLENKEMKKDEIINETPKRVLTNNKAKQDVLMFVLMLLSFIISFFIKNILPFLVAFLVLLILDWILKLKSKGKASESNVSDSGEKSTQEMNEFDRKYQEFYQMNRKIGKIATGIIIILFILAQFMDEAMIGVFITIPIAFIIAYINWRKEEQLLKSNLTINARETKRLEWVDQYRGMVVVFLIIAAGTWILSGKHAASGAGLMDYPPIGPTYLNHGWKFAEFQGWPNIITIIDIGQQILMFIVGYVGTLAYYKHREREGELGALNHVFRRFLALMIFAMIVEGELLSGELDLTEWSMVGTFWTSTFPNLAWGSLLSLLLVAALKKKPDQRFIIACIILAVHAILYAIPELHEWKISETVGSSEWVIFKVPWNTINHVSIAIVGTCTYDWYMTKTEENPELGWKNRILPVGTAMFIGTYLLDFLQPAEHHDATSALSMMAIATSMFVLYVFYTFDKIGYHIPGLTSFGKNILIMFLLTGAWDTFLHWFDRNLFVANPWLALLLVGIVPIMTQWLFAWSMDRFKIIIKF